MHVGSAVALLLLLSAGCVRHQPNTPAPDPQAAAKQPAATQSSEPAPPAAARPTAPAAPQPAAEPASSPPQPAAKPTASSPQEPVVTPPAPTPPTLAKPAAPTSPEPAAAPTSSVPSSPAPKQAAPKPSQPKPAAVPAPSATNPVAPAADSPVTSKPAATPTLDLDALKEEVKATSAIGFFTKITLKNQVDDLLDDFRAYHRGKAKLTMIELRRSYDLLLMKVLSLLQDKDPRLASSIVSSREAIWNLLADPKKFATLQG